MKLIKSLFCSIILLLFLTIPLFSNLVYASPDEAIQDPTTAGMGGFPRWNFATKAFTSNDDNAFASFDGSIQMYEDYDFDSVLPVDLEIVSVWLGLEFWCNADESLKIRVTVDGGTNWSAWSDYFTLEVEGLLWLDVSAYKESWERDYMLDGNWQTEVFMHTASGAGCFGNDMKVTLSDFSYKKIEDLEIGDKVLDYRNKTQAVYQVNEHINTNQTLFYNITSVDNRSLIIHGGHNITVSELLDTKLVFDLDLDDKLLSLDGSLVGISSIEPVYLTNFTNVLVSGSASPHSEKGMFYVQDFLVHNLEKEAWTAFLDWIPTKVIYTEAEEEEALDCDWIGTNNTVVGVGTEFQADFTDINQSNGLSHFRCYHNNTGSFINTSWTDSWIGNWSILEVTLNSTGDLTIAFRFYVNDTEGAEHESTICFFTTVPSQAPWSLALLVIAVLICVPIAAIYWRTKS